MKKFEIYPESDRVMIRHNDFPRFVGEITFVDMEKCTDAQIWAKTMREAGDFINNYINR